MKTKFFFLAMTICISSMSTLFAQEVNSKKNAEVTIKDIADIHMVYYEFTGPYSNSFTEFGALMKYLQTKDIPLGKNSLGVFYDNPEEIAEDKLRSEIGFLVAGPVEVSNGYKYKKIKGAKAVTLKYKSMEEIMSSYTKIADYIAKNNIQTEPYSIEFYYGNEPSKIDAEIVFLIKN